MAKLYFEDFSVGTVAEYGDTLVTAEEIKAFAAEFDPQPMHLDENAASQSMLRGLSGSGWHLCSLMMRMMADGFITRAASLGSPGVDEVRWLSPLRPGDDLMLDVDVLEARTSKSRPELGIVKFKCTVRNATSRGREARVSCEPAEMAISGGGTCEKGDLKGSRPLQAGTSPNGWEVSCGRSAQHTAYAVCCAQ